MSNDELWELQQERWKELEEGFIVLKGSANGLSTTTGYCSSDLWERLEQIKETAEDLQKICTAITRTAWGI